MAFLKSSQLSLGPKTIDVKGFTQAETLKLGDRAYTEHEVLLADNYNIVGDVTVSDDLIISKLSDDGNAITITGDTTTRTITGSGSIQGATLAQTPNATLTGMSGTLGSAVTNNAGVASGVISSAVTGTLGSGVTFPAGHVIGLLGKAQDRTRRQFTSRAANTWYDDYTLLNLIVTPKYASSLLWFVGQISYGVSSAASSVYMTFLKDGDATNTLNGDDTQTSGTYPCFHEHRWDMHGAALVYHQEQASINGYIMAGSTASQEFKIRYRSQGATDISFNKDGYQTPSSSPGSHSPSGISTLQIYEVQQ